MADKPLTWPPAVKQVTPEDVAATAQKFGFRFPEDYAQFLVTVNGGKPSKKKFVAGDSGVQTITAFYSLSEVALETRQFRGELELPPHYIPIALADQDIVLLDNGQVVLWSFIESGFRADRITPVAESFSAFLSMLQTKIAKP